MKKRILLLVLLVAITVCFSIYLAGAGEVRTVEPREDAIAGKSPTPADFPKEFLPGIDKPGAVPKKKYFIVFSNGDMSDAWRRTFVLDIEKWAGMYNKTFGVKYLWTNSGNNSTLQLSQVQSLIAMKPDLLLLSPNEVEPLTPVADMCEKAWIPLIVLDRELGVHPEKGKKYFQFQGMDYYLNGLATGLGIVIVGGS